MTIGGGDVVTLEDMREFLVAYSRVRAADAYYKPRWSRPRSREEVRAGRFGDPNDGG